MWEYYEQFTFRHWSQSLLIADVNACVTQKGLEHVKTDSAPRSFSPSSRSVFSSRLNCTESSGKKLHKGSVAASNRWRDDSNTLDPVPNFTAKKDKKQGCSQSQEHLMSLPKSLGTDLQECSPASALPTEDLADVEDVWPQTFSSRYRKPVKWLFAEAPMQSTTFFSLQMINEVLQCFNFFVRRWQSCKWTSLRLPSSLLIFAMQGVRKPYSAKPL